MVGGFFPGRGFLFMVLLAVIFSAHMCYPFYDLFLGFKIINIGCLYTNYSRSLFSWSQKFVSIQMYHMIRHIRQPHFCFPCQLITEFFICIKIWKCCNKHFPSRNIFSHSFYFNNSLWIHRANACNSFYKINPVLIRCIKDYIWHFIMICYCKT